MNPAVAIVAITVAVSWMLMEREEKSRLLLIPSRVVQNKEWHRVVTHALIHADWMHLVFNMFVLYEFGRMVALELPPLLGGFWGLYLAGVFGGAIPALRKHANNPRYASLGASGGTSAVLMAFIALHPTHTLLLFFVIPIPAVLAGVLFFWYEGKMNQSRRTGIAHDAHLGGGLVGLLWVFVLLPGSLRNAFAALASLLP